MSAINTDFARRVARLMSKREAELGIRLEIASIEFNADDAAPVVTFRPWSSTRPGSVDRKGGDIT